MKFAPQDILNPIQTCLNRIFTQILSPMAISFQLKMLSSVHALAATACGNSKITKNI